MKLLTTETKTSWAAKLKDLPVNGDPLQVDIMSAGGVRQAISVAIKRSNPEMEFETKKRVNDSGKEYLEVTRLK